MQTDAAFHADVARFLADFFPEYAADREALAATVDLALLDARGFGLESARALAMYALLALLLGHEIRDDERLRNLLLSSGLNEEGKADAMGDWITNLARTLDG